MDEPANNERRAATDRRANADRRRGGEGRRLVLHLGRSELRAGLIVTDARGAADLLHTVTISWRGDAAPLPADEGFEALAEALKKLVADERLSGCSAALVLNGDLCVTRVTAGPTPEVNQAVDEINERCQLYLSLGTGGKTQATSRANLDARHERAVVSIAREETLSRLIEIVSAAGIELRCIEAETVALARAHGALHDDQDAVILVQFDGEGFEIALAEHGNLLLDYRPSGCGDGLLEVLRHHQARLERFCQRHHHDFGPKLRKVYLAGNSPRMKAAQRELAADPAYDVELLNSSAALEHWQRAPDSLDPADGVLVGRLAEEIGVAPAAPAPNLMGRWIAESRKHIRPMLLRSAAPLAAVLLVALGIALVNFRVSGRAATLKQRVKAMAAVQAEYDELRLTLQVSNNMLTQMEQLHGALGEANMTGAVTAPGLCMPDEVWWRRLMITDMSSAAVSGSSYGQSGVYEFVGHLNDSPMFSQVALEGTGATQSRDGLVTSFDLTFMLASGDDPTREGEQ